jgi:hypothetical protein
MLVLVIEHDLFGSKLNWECTHPSDTALSTVKSALRHLLECQPCVIEKALIASTLSLAGKVDEMLLRSSERHLGIAPSLIVKVCEDHLAAFIHA